MTELKLVDVTDNAVHALRQSGWIIKTPYFTATGEPVFVAVRNDRVSLVCRVNEHNMNTKQTAH